MSTDWSDLLGPHPEEGTVFFERTPLEMNPTSVYQTIPHEFEGA